MKNAQTETTIQASKGWQFIDWRELWAYRDLLSLLVWRDFVARYKQTILGPLWFIVQPLLTTLVFTLVFDRFAKIPTSGVSATLFYLCGLLGWNYFSQTFQSTSTTLTSNASLFGKVYFPRLIVPIAGVVSNLTAFAIQLFTFGVIYVIMLFFPTELGAAHLNWDALLLPLVVLQIGLFSLGTGLWLAALTAKFRDFIVLATFLIQLWMYATPVIYPLETVPERWKFLVALNPMTMPVELLRHMLLGSGSTDPKLIMISVGMTLFALVSGVLIFKRAEKNFVDII